MLKSYLTQLWRRLTKDKTYSLLNIVGLSAGLTCFAFITLWVYDELNYDKFNHNYDQIVRLVGIVKKENNLSVSAVSSAPMAQALRDDYAEVENTVRFQRKREEVVQYKNKQTLETILLTDPSFFDIFSYRLTRGNVATALKEPYSVILTESTAKKYFGEQDPIGQILTIYLYDNTGNGASYTVTGITPDPPKNAHFTFTVLGSFKTVEVANPEKANDWSDNSFYTYLLLKKGVNQADFSRKITRFHTKYSGNGPDKEQATYSYILQPLRNIHLSSHLENEIAPTGNVNQIYIFSTISIFILLLAGINYTNLATARSAGRAKEVSIKKVLGAVKKQLIWQYLLEAVVMALMALLFSLLVSFFIQPFFYQVTGKNLSLFSSPPLLLFLTGVTILLGILSGVYPAFILSAFKPAAILKGPFKSGIKGVWLRRSLVITQFVITLILITGIVIIYTQMSYIKHKDLGYNKDALLFLRVNGNSEVIQGYNAFKNELTASPFIAGVATSNSSIVNGLDTGGSATVDLEGKPLLVNTSKLEVDTDYLTVYGIKLVAGTNFTRHLSSDTLGQIILNESAVKKIGWRNAENAIGKPFAIDNQHGKVIGVIHDFHFDLLQQPIEPLAIYQQEEHFSRITIKVDPKKVSQSKAFIEAVWTKHFPAALFDYNFLDQYIEEQYQAEERFSAIILYSSLLSLLIACLGLYGLIAYSTEQKTKEIGIRKVLGATISGIAVMLSKDFLKLVIVACFIALPIAWYIMHEWLQDFAYRINISWWMFAAAVLPVFLLTLITVSFQAIKAAIANPIDSLRTE